MPEEEIVRNLIRHFDETIVEAARCRNIRGMDSLLCFLNEMQSGGRSNTPKSRGLTNYKRVQIDEKPRQVSWRLNNSAVSQDKSNPRDDITSRDNRRRPEQNNSSTNRSLNWTEANVNAISRENNIASETEDNLEEQEN